MSDASARPVALVVRLTQTPTGAVRIEHAYESASGVDEYAAWAQVPRGAHSRIRTVWNELRVLVAIWLEHEHTSADRDQAPAPTQASA